MTEKPIAIAIPTWDPNEPRFIKKECLQCSEDRQFKTGDCVYNQRLGLAYSVDDIVEVLNDTHAEKTYKKIRNKYMDIKKDKKEDYSKDEVMRIIKDIAEVGEVDLREYPKITYKELISIE